MDLGRCSAAELEAWLPGLRHPSRARDAGLDLAPLQRYEEATSRARALRHMPGCSSIAILDDQVLQVGSFGSADLEHGLPMATDSIVRLYCLTKPMVATGLMILVERGLCKLDDEVSKHLPEFKSARVCAKKTNLVCSPDDKPLAARSLTLRRLLTHSSGLGYAPSLGMDPSGPDEEAYAGITKQCDSGKIRSLEQLSKAVAALPLRFHPGERYMYSFGLDIAGRVIEVLSGKSLDRFLRMELFDPIGMKDTGYSVPPRVARKRMAALYATKENMQAIGEKPGLGAGTHKSPLGTLVRIDGQRPEHSAWVGKRSCPVFSGGGIMGQNRGGLVSTLADQARFYLMLLRGGRLSPKHKQILLPKTVELMWGSDWLCRPSAVGRKCRDKGTLFGWHALGEIGIVKRPMRKHYPDTFEFGEWGMAGAACTHVTVVPHRKLLCLWFTQTLEGWPGWKAPEQNLWSAAREVALKRDVPARKRPASSGATASAAPEAKRRRAT